MSIGHTLLPEFDNEMSNTRRTLERVPEDKFEWKPHEKSMPLGQLAVHLATLPTWAVYALAQDSLDIAPPGEAPQSMPEVGSRGELLSLFDESVSSAREALAGASDERMLGDWSLLKGGRTILTMPRVAVLRSFVMNHNIHHRAQLGVYLRLNDLPVPSIYGPSADEGEM
jgi:uncharacterized damage-inducible protein DinB